jgi:hypothetical protein
MLEPCRPQRVARSLTSPQQAVPSGAELLALEAEVRRLGTGLVASDLAGGWMLEQVWGRGSSQPSDLSARLLRSLGARLEIQPMDDSDTGAVAAEAVAAGAAEAQGADAAAAESTPQGLAVNNAVRIGALELRFCGRGQLEGRRPLLSFAFTELRLSLGGRLLLQRHLPAPSPRRMPFFALIARHPCGWLAARGRGGGLALWRLG